MSPITKNMLEEFSLLQGKLLTNFFARYPNAKDRFMHECPKTGFIEIEGKKWKFIRHGAGVMFIGDETSEVVDAHRIYADIYEAFDAWRVLQYAESRGISAITERSVQESLERMLRHKEIELIQDKHLYKVRA
jgi:hypothetical protein